MVATVDAKGQVVLPEEVRELLQLRPGSKVEFQRGPQGQVVLVNAEGLEQDRFAGLVGRADAGLTTDEIMTLTRGEF